MARFSRAEQASLSAQIEELGFKLRDADGRSTCRTMICKVSEQSGSHVVIFHCRTFHEVEAFLQGHKAATS